VIEGDQQTSHDADRIRATGAPAIQVNTGKGCHLDAQMVGEAFARLPLHGPHDHAQGHSHGHSSGHSHGDLLGDSHGQSHGHTHGDLHGHSHDDSPGRSRDLASAEPNPLPRGRGGLLFVENVGNLVCPAMWDLGERAKVAILSVTEGDDKPIKYPDMFAAATAMVLTKVDLLPHVDFDIARCIAYAQRVNPGIEVLLLSAKSGQGMDAWLDWLLQGITLPAEPNAPPAVHEAAA